MRDVNTFLENEIRMRSRKGWKRCTSRASRGDTNNEPLESQHSTQKKMQEPGVSASKKDKAEVRGWIRSVTHSTDRASSMLDFCSRGGCILVGEVDQESAKHRYRIVRAQERNEGE